jgi:predicted Holliday junction resolvase-like endonuclease
LDLVVFDGCNVGDVRQIVFLEIKTASSGLSPKQRQIRDAVLAGRVVLREMKVQVEA